MIEDTDQLDELTDDQLWEAAANRENPTEVRMEAIQRWLNPEETTSDGDPDDLGGGRFRELRHRATVLEGDEVEDDDIEDVEDSEPYFDAEGQMIIEHNGVTYLIDSIDDEGSYDGIEVKDDLYSTDDKTNQDRDI